MWSLSTRDEQQQMVDMLRSSMGRGREPRRVHCPGDFPRGPLPAELAAEMLYQLEHRDAPQMGNEELVGRLARAKKDARRSRVLDAYVMSELKQAAYTANGRVASLALSSGVMSPRAYVALEAQRDSGEHDGFSYEGFLGDVAYQRALERALPAAVKAVDTFLDSLGKNAGLWSVYDAIRDLVQPHYYQSYLEEFITDLQLEGDIVLERAAALTSDERWDDYLRGMYDRLPEGEYRLVDLLTPDMFIVDEERGYYYRQHTPDSFGELLAAIDREINELNQADAAKWEAVVLERRKASSPRYKQLLQEELARDVLPALEPKGRLRRLLA